MKAAWLPPALAAFFVVMNCWITAENQNKERASLKAARSIGKGGAQGPLLARAH
jgi:hypothetical protein